MKTREQIAADLYNFGRDSVMQGGYSLRTLATHISDMVYGIKGNDGALWKDRAFNDKIIHLDSFEDYLLKPARDGLGIPSLLWLARVLDAHEDKEEREKALAALRQEIADFDARVDEERLKMRNRQTVPETTHGGSREGAGRKAKEEDANQETNCHLKKRKSSQSPERIIARLKRDAETNPHAEALLGSIEAGDLKPYRAAVEMGWVKPPDPLAIIDRHFDKLDVADQVKVWEEWGRALPGKSVDRVAIAVEALLNCTEREQRQAWQQVRAMTGSAAHC